MTQYSNEEIMEAAKEVYGDSEDLIEMLEEENEQGGCSALCGCWVEPDGFCGKHQKPSFLLALGYI